MRNVLNFQDDITLPEEVCLAEQDRHIDELCDTLETMVVVHNILVSENSSEEAKTVARERAKFIIETEDCLDAENYGEGFEIAGKIIMAIIGIILKIAEYLFRYMLKVISFTAQAYRESEKLQSHILSTLHGYADVAPMIPVTENIKSVIGKELVLLDPYAVSKLYEQDLDKYDPTLFVNRVSAGISGIISELRLGLKNDDAMSQFSNLSDDLSNVLQNVFGAKKARINRQDSLVYGLPNLPYSIQVIFNDSDAPEVFLVANSYRVPDTVEGYKPTDAHVVVSASKRVFGRILERDDGVAFQKEANELVKELKKEALRSSEESVRRIPQWVKFVRNYIKQVNSYEYRIALGALEAVKESKKRWSERND